MDSTVLHGAQLLGDNVAFWQGEGFYLFDGELFRSADARGRLATGLELSECQLHRAAPRLRTGPDALFVCGAQLARFSGDRLGAVDHATLGGLSHPAAVWVDLDADLVGGAFEWVGDTLWRATGSPPEVQRWDAERAAWATVWRSTEPHEDDHPVALGAARLADQWEVWLLERGGRVWHGLAEPAGDPSATELRAVAQVPSPVVGRCPADALVALGPAGALVRRCGRAWSVRVGSEPEPFTSGELAGGFEAVLTASFTFPRRVGSHVLGYQRRALTAVGSDGALTSWTVAGDAGGHRARAIETVAYDEAEDGTLTVVLGSGHDAGVVRCRDRVCTPLPLPVGVRPRGVLHLEGTRYLILAEGGLGLLDIEG